MRRTWWLLREGETRNETARYLAAHAFAYTRAAARAAMARSAGRGSTGRASAR